MSLKVSGTIVVDNNRNVTNVEGYYGDGVANQDEAKLAADDTKLMTPLKVKDSIEENAVAKVGGSTGAALLPGGSQSDRPTPVIGMLRYTSTGELEYYDGNQWLTLARRGSGLQDPRGWFGHTTNP